MILQRFDVSTIHNANADRDRLYGNLERRVLSLDGLRKAEAEITAWPGYAPTPLLSLDGLAAGLKIGTLLYKDEGQRLGLKSFKAIGGAYAVLAVLRESLATQYRLTEVATSSFLAGEHREKTQAITVAAATDGNHGRSVAWGAKVFGCNCVIYLHGAVSPTREREIARHGARIERVEGMYDDSVRACEAASKANSWVLVADTSDDPNARVPSLIMQGYMLIAEEIFRQYEPQRLPTHIVVQAGVGGLAAAVAAYCWERFGPARPRIVVVEPSRADCVFRSIAAGRRTSVPGDTNTVMACLAAGEVSAPAWVVLKHAVDDVISLPEEAAPHAMRILAAGVANDPSIVAGESGGAAVAGLIAAALDPKIRRAFDLGPQSTVVAIGSEGATDLDAYRHIVGQEADSVVG
jgi:diaminopropionate ammonia-lyase